jgi:guanine deaminase
LDRQPPAFAPCPVVSTALTSFVMLLKAAEEPCAMCFAAIYRARPERIYYAATCEDATAAGFDDAPFYRQLGLPPDRRAIPMVNALRQEACEAFAAWLRKPDRVAC